MNLKLTASSQHEDLVKELRIDMYYNLEPELNPNQCCIYRVPKQIRNVNEEAYTPQIVSIGPLHHGRKELTKMEKKKRNYMKSFLEQRIIIKRQEDIFSFVKNNENMIRNYYAETSDLKSHEYVMMILYDTIFIIELFMRNFEILMGKLEGKSDLFLSSPTVRFTLTSDLGLLENQLPYFVLEEIYELASCSIMPSFMNISCGFFRLFSGLDLIELTPQYPVKHFTDWRRRTLLEKYPGSDQKKGYITDLPCAKKLHECGVKFKKIEEDKPLRFEKRGHELQLPPLVISDGVECLLRNVMALEQCHYPGDTHICNYINLMDSLIDTEKDVDLLVESGIFSKSVGDNSSIAEIFNKLGRNISVSRSSYYDICEELKKHCNNPWNKTMAMLRSVYFSNLWKGTGTIAAVVLLVLTVIQTICSLLQV